MSTGIEIEFAPDPEVHVHEEGAIRLICAQFRSHEDGLPEWLKNSSDMYIRTNSSADESVIVVMFRDGERGRLSSVGCLDFGGMTTADIEGKFRHWADPEASGRDDSAAVEGGHGNGGKCYMTQMFEHYAYIHTIREGRGNRYGFVGGKVVPGYFPSSKAGRGYPVTDIDKELGPALSVFDLKIASLPEDARRALQQKKAFTLVAGFGARHHPRRIPSKALVENLQNHQQTVQTLLRNKVYCFANGHPMEGAFPLRLPEIIPIRGAESSRVIPVPSVLIDPNTANDVQTGAIQGESVLELKTSNVSMRFSLKARHTINGWTHARRSTGSWQVPELSRAAYANKIYGDLRLDSLDQYKQNDRRRHTEAPLTRALTDWLAERIEEYSAEFVKLDQLQASQEERNELSRLNKALDEWKNKFLQKEFGGLGTRGAGGTGGGVHHPRLPRGTPVRVVLSLTHTMAGQGVTFRPSLDFYDSEGKRIRAIPHNLISSDWAVATVDDLGLITTHGPGKVEIKVVCTDSGLTSNLVVLEVLDIAEVIIEPATLEVPMGGRRPLRALAKTSDGKTVEGAYLIWTESNDQVIAVGASGMVFGLAVGEAEVVAGDNQILSEQPAGIKVVEMDRRAEGGTGFPLILLSEVDKDPIGEVPPIFSSEDPPVHQRPQDVDKNIWWINMASPLARRYLDAARQGGAKSKEWRAYLLERYIEVMVKILLQYDYDNGEELTFETMLRRWDEESVLMQQRASESLQGFLDEGARPVSAQ